MSALGHIRDENQVRAADPAACAWVSANAGTGKTAVLVRRVLRLLLAGTQPEKILCLTYTKTAAAEMQNRLLDVLAAWATKDEEALREELHDLTEEAPADAMVHAARRLFARSLEAKGGLKIYTIHGFCERLLQRFPLEASVTPHFTVLDDQSAFLLRHQAFDSVVDRATGDGSGLLAEALAKVVAVSSEDQIRGLVNAILAKRADLLRLAQYHDDENWIAQELAALRQSLGIAASDTEDLLIAELAGLLSEADIDSILADCADHPYKVSDEKIFQALAAAKGIDGEARVDALRPLFYTGEGDARSGEPLTKGLRAAVPNSARLLSEARDSFVPLYDKLTALRCAEASAGLLALADAVQSAYDLVKRQEASLDYDDLILKASQLFDRAGAAAWVLFKLDGGIDHILVDEAQDTNPDQWAIVEKLAEEFFAGEGASDRMRTLFAVGDEKQSIYSFQGAVPQRFIDIGGSFRKKVESVRRTWHALPLTLSFRSTVPILDSVDKVFAQPLAAKGVQLQDLPIVHTAFRQGQAGLVELWDVEEVKKPDSTPAFAPLDEESAERPAVEKLCERIAKTIRHWLDTGEQLESQGRPIRPGDILILVRQRDPFVSTMIRQLKTVRIPVAGADRMLLADQLAVEDLLALADFLLMPEDDLALAIVLKSPFFGFDDDALFSFAHGRGRGVSLWEALKAAAKQDHRFADTVDRLRHWRDRARFLAPYEFFAELLGAENQSVRGRLLSRLGPEAADALDELLNLALLHDQRSAPSLQGFVQELRATQVEIKRDMEQARNEVRIMTVHGAKGLQAPIVFLPDTCRVPRQSQTPLHRMSRSGSPPGAPDHLLWTTRVKSVELIQNARDASSHAELEEYNRLLYVAMTRAQDRLYLCGWRGMKNVPNKSWYKLLESGLQGSLEKMNGLDGTSVRAYRSPQEAPVKQAEEPTPPAEPAAMPDWAKTPAKPELSPSRFVASNLSAMLDAEDGESPPEQTVVGPASLATDNRYERGLLVHALLQHLPAIPPDGQKTAARAFVAARAGDLPEADAAVVDETLAVIQEPGFAPLFQPGSLAEVPIIASIDAAGDVSGQIDRLVVTDREVLIVDYKTNRPPPVTPEEVAPGYVSQLAAYRAALRKIYPIKRVRAALLWTDGPRLMEIPENMLDASERRMLQRSHSP
jgi:ATP-dependent helicase/nuclease subunit A